MESQLSTLQRQVATLLIYRDVLNDEVGRAFVDLLRNLQLEAGKEWDCLEAYSVWFRALADRNLGWQEYLLQRILTADNPFTRQLQHQSLQDLPPVLVAAVKSDLQLLQGLYACPCTQLSQWVAQQARLREGLMAWADHLAAFHLQNPAAVSLCQRLQSLPDWADGVADLAAYYRHWGSGLMGEYRAFRWQAGRLVGIATPDPVRLTDLVGYESQQQALLQNTEALLGGYPALHVLLYGSRGSGKSSLVKSLLHQYGDRGLRLVEVAKSDLGQLPEIVTLLRDRPQKFVVFVDDLSFEEEESSYKALKVVLEGNLMARPQNLVVYATSNRRHLIREFFGDRPRPSDAEEVHAWDTVQEKLSFSDRFGLTLTFEPADQTTYLKIVHHLATQAAITLESRDLEHRALQWATRHNGRSGRTARQFVDFLRAELGL